MVMNTEKKLFLLFTAIMTLFAVAIMINAALNFRNYSYNSAIDKAHMAAELVRDGLTAHMVNGMMDKRAAFLEMMSEGDSVKSLWIVRSESVIKQFGKGFKSEMPKDEIDKEVLKSGKEKDEFYEDFENATLRVTIPYTASSYGKINCLQCHNAKEGEVLGAVSLKFDVREIRREGIWTLVKIAIITLVFIFLSLLIIKHFTAPYIIFFKKLEKSLMRAKHGDFSMKVRTQIKAKDVEAVAHRYNELIEKFNKTVGKIEKKLAIFLKGSTGYCEDPLEQATHTIDMLSDIHRFKNTIELDSDAHQVLTRLASVIEDIVSPQRLLIFEVEADKGTRKVVYNSGIDLPCTQESMERADICRAYRTKKSVFSDLYPQLCPGFQGGYKYYYCIPFDITSTYSVVIMMLSNDKEKVNLYKREETVLMYYLENSKPVIESKILMQKLKERSVRDGLTGLYNRKFLEEVIDKINKQADRKTTKYAVMMLDIDSFKMINDTYGHDIGDSFIKLLVECINHEIRSSDIAARYGGEEFVVLLHEASYEGALRVAEKIRTMFAKIPISIGDKNVTSTVSIGISLYPENTASLREAIKFADIALYKAKRGGRNRVVLFGEEVEKSEEKEVNSYLFEDNAPE